MDIRVPSFFYFFHLGFVAKAPNCQYKNSLILPYFKITTIKISRSFVPFILLLEDDHCMNMSKYLLSLGSNLRLGSMYVEQETYFMNGDILETILIPKIMCQNGYFWILNPESFRIIGLPDSRMQASIILLTNEYGASTINVPSVATVNIEPSDNVVLVLLVLDEDVCHIVNFFDTSQFLYNTKPSDPVLVFVDIDKTLYNPSYIK